MISSKLLGNLGLSRETVCLPRITTRLCLLCLVAVVRTVAFLIEQPRGSCMMTSFPYWVFLRKVLEHFYTWMTCSLYLPQFPFPAFKKTLSSGAPINGQLQLSSMAVYGHESMKPTLTWGTWPGP